MVKKKYIAKIFSLKTFLVSEYVVYVLKNFRIFKGRQLFWSLVLIKLQARMPATLLKRDSNVDLFLSIWEIFKNTFFHKTPPMAPSVILMNLCFMFSFRNVLIFKWPGV